MMGESKYMGRDELLRMKFTGESKPISSHMQKIFDKGHATEEMARPIVEKIIEDDLYPVTGLLENSKILASFDGLTMMEDIAFEHKLYNATLAENVRNNVLEPHYYWQLEQQLLVSGAEKVIFVTSDGTEDNFESMWYESVPERRKALILGWEQFDKELDNYRIEAKKEIVVAAEQESFPLITCKVEGSTVISNLGEFIPKIKAAIDERLSVILETDQDFADTEAFVKNIKATRVKLKQEKINITNAFESYSAFVNDVEITDGILQKAESTLNSAVKTHKASKKLSIVNNAYIEFNKHLAGLSETINGVQINQVVVNFEAVMKGKRSFDKMEETVNSALANAKIEANEISIIIRKNLDSLTELAKNHKFLFSDHAALLLKDNDDLINLIKARISEHELAEVEHKRLEKEKIEAEAKIKAEHEAEEKQRKINEFNQIAQNNINHLIAIPASMVGQTSEELNKELNSMDLIEINEAEYGSLFDQANLAKAKVIVQLGEMAEKQAEIEKEAVNKLHQEQAQTPAPTANDALKEAIVEDEKPIEQRLAERFAEPELKTVREFLSAYCESEGYGTEDDSLIEALTEGNRVWNSDYMDEHRWYICNEVVNEINGVFIKYTDYIITGDNGMSDMDLSYDLDSASIVQRKERQVIEVYYE